jgi:thymidylate synthase
MLLTVVTLNTNVRCALYQRVFWRGVVEELLWFISGSTNAKVHMLKHTFFFAYTAVFSPVQL